MKKAGYSDNFLNCTNQLMCSMTVLVVYRTQNVLTGWGVGIGVVLVVVSLEYKNYGGKERERNVLTVQQL